MPTHEPEEGSTAHRRLLLSGQGDADAADPGRVSGPSRMLRGAREAGRRGPRGLPLRVEQDGTIQRVCTGDATSVDDEDAVRCMVAEVKKARFPAMSDAERDLCGLVTLDYPLVFEP